MSASVRHVFNAPRSHTSTRESKFGGRAAQQASGPRLASEVKSVAAGFKEPDMVNRRMDSLARVMNSFSDDMYHGVRTATVATALAFAAGSKPGERVLAIAHNAEDPQQLADDKARLRIVQDAVIGKISAADAARELAPSSGLPRRQTSHKRLGAVDRLIKDFAKLRASHEGRYDDRPGGAEFKAALHDLFGTATEPKEPKMESHTMHGGRGRVHAEAALIARGIIARGTKEKIGVSKLSCGDCYDYADKNGQTEALRGTHGRRFPGWKHPDTGRVEHRPRVGPIDTLAADDSASDVE